MLTPKSSNHQRTDRRTALGRILTIASVLALLAVGLSTGPAAAQTTAYSVSVIQYGSTADIKLHVTMDQADIGKAPRYKLAVRNKAGRHLAQATGSTPELEAGRQRFTVTTEALRAIKAGSYTGELRLYNGNRVVLKKQLGWLKVSDGNDPPPTTKPPTTQPPTTEPPTTTTKPPTNGSGPLDSVLEGYVAGLPSNTAIGIGSTTGLRRPTTANLPPGAKLNGNEIKVSNAGTELQGWDLSGYRVVVQAPDVTIKGNVLGERSGPADIWDYILVKSGAHNLVIEANSFFGVDGEGGKARAAIYQDSGNGQPATGVTIRFNRFENLPNDSVKLAGGGATLQWNAFMLARNLNSVPKPWSATTTYRTGDYALNAKNHVFKSTTNNNRGVPVPTAKKGKSTPNVWQWFDPHSDQITVYAAVDGVDISYNYFATGSPADRVQGTTNAIRLLRNTDTRPQYDRVVVRGNYIEPNRLVGGSAITVSSGNQPNFNGPIEIRHNWIGARKGGLYLQVEYAAPIWDTNVDATTGQAPTPASGTVVRSTPPPQASITPAPVKAGHR